MLMKKLCQLLNKKEDELFTELTSSFKDKITQWNYFVNWQKVLQNIEPIEKELYKETVDLLLKYSDTIKAIPLFLAIREKFLKVLIDTRNFIYREFNFSKKEYTKKEVITFAGFILNTDLGELLKDKKIKNLVDYVTGVEVRLDSNGRKNRGGTLMESIVEEFVRETCNDLHIEYMPQATAKK